MVAVLPGDIVDAAAYKGGGAIQIAHFLETPQARSRSKFICCCAFEPDFPHVRDDEADSVREHMNSFEADAKERLSRRLLQASAPVSVVGKLAPTASL